MIVAGHYEIASYGVNKRPGDCRSGKIAMKDLLERRCGAVDGAGVVIVLGKVSTTEIQAGKQAAAP